MSTRARAARAFDEAARRHRAPLRAAVASAAAARCLSCR
ncbi:hypothetical protein BURMUCGD1_4334 [Burkholderia multivorans CGD1]|nr:hypothetical protein BURMUCGD1_4334 [Burkholderia multivorans CGD1]